MQPMATAHSTKFEKTFTDPKTGRLFTVRGFGALKGQLDLDKSIDLTKPIAEQVFGTSKGKSPLTKR